ncbi:MAG TPA: nucleoside transporter C-terminal domain-containing protein [Gemmatimonadales bacterium]|nr:nucleoside transporter C-terminal domain-containing protein [Gemmatimonadales bacterium]
MSRFAGVLGLVAMIGIAALLSTDRRRIPWRLVGMGLLLQVAFGVLVLRTVAGRAFFDAVGDAFSALLRFQEQGARFVFGNLVQPTVPVGVPGAGGALDTAAGYVAGTGALIAFSVLPTIIFFAALMQVLYHLGVMQRVVRAIAWVMQRTLRTSGAETLSAAGEIFLGHTEAPLLVKPFIGRLTGSELFTVMTCGLATVAGGVMAAYIGMLQGAVPGIAGHLLAASVMNVPAALYLSKVMQPETGVPETAGTLDLRVERTEAGVIEAAAAGAGQGLTLALNVGAMLIAFVALVALLNALLGWAGGFAGHPELSVQLVLGTLLRPLAWLMGVPWADTTYVGGLVGLKVTLNEFVAYAQFAGDLRAGAVLDPRSGVILTYALLGFANFASIGIQIGGLGSIAPERRGEIARLGLRALVAGNLAAFTSASIAGVLT